MISWVYSRTHGQSFMSSAHHLSLHPNYNLLFPTDSLQRSHEHSIAAFHFRDMLKVTVTSTQGFCVRLGQVLNSASRGIRRQYIPYGQIGKAAAALSKRHGRLLLL